MAELMIPLRYQPAWESGGEAFREENFRRREVHVTLESADVALVIRDLLDCGWHDEPLDPEVGFELELGAEHGLSFGKRMKQITVEKIIPALQAARQAGLTVAHWNVPEILRRYPQWVRCNPEPAKPQSKKQSVPSDGGSISSKWPPPDLVSDFRKRYNLHVHNPKREALRPRLVSKVDLPEPAKPVGDELVAAEGIRLHELLAERKVKVVFVAGFWANACIRGAVRHFSRLGYLSVLLRDATTGSEFAHTLDGMWMTEVAITEMEFDLGFTTSTDSFIQTCRTVEEARWLGG